MKIFSPVFSGEMKEANSSSSAPKPLALISEGYKALLDTLDVRDDGGAFMNLGMNHPGGDEYFYGQIAAFRIYNKLLTASNVVTNFNAQRARFGA